MKKLSLFVLMLFVLSIVSIMSVSASQLPDKQACSKDADCICDGKDIQTNECYVGNAGYYNLWVNKNVTCPDFCTGIDGKAEPKCVNHICKIVRSDVCIENNGQCCLGDVCTTVMTDCIEPLSPKFLGCSDTCMPQVECVKITPHEDCGTVTSGYNNECCVNQGFDKWNASLSQCVKITPPVNCAVVPARDACCNNQGYDKWDASLGKCVNSDDTLTISNTTEVDDDTETTREMPAKDVISVGTTCKISEELQQLMMGTKALYQNAIVAKDFAKAKELREKLADLEKQSYEERKECMTTVVPGLIDNNNRTCVIPSELYDQLEKDKYRVSELNSLNTSLPEDLKAEIKDIELKIALHKARCNGLKVSNDVHEEDVAEYYKNRMTEALSNPDMDTKVENLRELRKEIDETIKNLIEQKKKLNYKDMEGMVDNIEFKAKHVSVGDSETNGTDLEVEVETNDSKVRIKPTELAVLLSQEGYNVTADDITVNDSGIYVQGILIKTLPKAVFEHNKNLEQNAERMIGMKLEKEGNKAVYIAQYDVKKKLFWIIPTTAKYELKIDAENGETLQEKKPWWSGMAKTVKDDIEETTALLNETEVSVQ